MFIAKIVFFLVLPLFIPVICLFLLLKIAVPFSRDAGDG